MTEEEFNEKWGHLNDKDKQFIYIYLDTLSIKEAGMGICRWRAREKFYKLKDIIDYIFKRDNVFDSFFSPDQIKQRLIDLYDNSEDEKTKLAILKEIMQFIDLGGEKRPEESKILIKFDDGDTK